ncbi:RsmB/NOP family class I SAM-dependent RNA methyltransferase [Vitreoscilla massiliensis]|uniref:RsmB/NOP family class I SAM-dependent RNA methyltransferase n=1 Tax=Vitreoscilla massiliensis TaxID=1689272 RepID=A0ABY4E521_9NEIS|nr:RsmB/NOP family class I SAM-dependent RNA methyltransferase [Vitreoscilla massiliensis]UOO90485.1 RsmB/NOP family class I SAM-dependent RNA methyltransferase [Vitreoscilla massiliensis]
MNNPQLIHTERLIAEVSLFRSPADMVLSKFFKDHKKLGRQDRHEIAETVYAALRHWQKLHMVLGDKAPTRLLALGALVIGRGVSIASLSDIINEAERTALSGLKAAKTEFTGRLNTASELPQWLVERMQGQYSDEDIVAIGQALSHAAPLDTRVNTIKGKRDKVLAQLAAEGFKAEATPFSPWGIRFQDKAVINKNPLFLDGILEVQDEGSQLLALLSGAKRGEVVVDFCAGAGGKTLAMAAMMNNTGRLYAMDVSEKRLANIKPRIARAGVGNITPQRLDHERDLRLKKLWNKADRVLVDAPCSGLGTLRRNPDLKYRQSNDSIDELVTLQARILDSAAHLVKRGGYLIYATCSVLAEENQNQIQNFLSTHSEFSLVNCSDLLKSNKIALDTGEFLQLNPATHHTDGFFAAVMQKSSS